MESIAAARALVVKDSTTDERTMWYVNKLFDYTNQLIERTQVRCNYLILSNSVAAVAFLTTMSSIMIVRGNEAAYVLTKQYVQILSLVPLAVFLASLTASVLAFLPKIYKFDIEINQDFIAKKSEIDYREFVLNKSDKSMLRDFIDEIHVLSLILNDRTRLVNLSARLLIVALISLVPAVVGALV